MDEKDFEIAALLELMQRESGIEQARKTMQHVVPPDYDGSCLECGSPVEPGRVALGYYVCVFCVAEQELRRKQHI
jgi:hypothetical protein